jgi:hypothetical protein
MKTSTETIPDVEDLARGLLRNTPYSALRRVACDYRDGTLVLSGELPSYYLKQMAQTAVANVPGVARVVNHIDVVPALLHPAVPV